MVGWSDAQNKLNMAKDTEADKYNKSFHSFATGNYKLDPNKKAPLLDWSKDEDRDRIPPVLACCQEHLIATKITK